jgi:hypothetical protein
MRPEDLADKKGARPFVPFRIHMSDGRFFDIVHSGAILLMETRAIIGLRPDPETIIFDCSEQIALLDVVRTSDIPPL